MNFYQKEIWSYEILVLLELLKGNISMDMYYYIKDQLDCQDCKHPLKFSKDIGYLSYIAICVVCGKEYEISLDIKLNNS
jgi:hypothetical protein